MTEERFEVVWETDEMCNIFDNEMNSTLSVEEVEEKLNALYEENQSLKQENNMLRVTIGRNEAYIDRLTHQSYWDNKTI